MLVVPDRMCELLFDVLAALLPLLVAEMLPSSDMVSSLTPKEVLLLVMPQPCRLLTVATSVAFSSDCTLSSSLL